MIPLFSTYIDQTAQDAVSSVLTSTFLSEGEKTRIFEEKLARLGLMHPVCVNSGTSALHLALIAANVGPEDEVIIPAQTFIATGLAVLYVGATPVFADIEYETGNIDPEDLARRITKKTRAIIPVHWAGYPANMQRISQIAREHNLVVIEDAAHALGALYDEKPIGTLSPYTCFSFQAIKHLTTGDGGAIACKNATTEQRLKKLRWFGIDRVRAKPSILGERQYLLDEVGYKYHMNDYAAVLGIANIRTLKKRLARRRKVAATITKALERCDGITPFSYSKKHTPSWWIYGAHVERRNDFIKAMQARNITVSVVHQRIDKHPIFGGIRKDLVMQKAFDASQIHLPVHEELTDEKLDYMLSAIRKGW